jgi:exodeoxyribonuclease-3
MLTWNVNGLKSAAKKGALLSLVTDLSPDVAFLQELRCSPEDAATLLPRAFPGYQCLHNCSTSKKGYSGVAIATRVPAERHWHGLSLPDKAAPDPEGRCLTALLPASGAHPPLCLVCVYAPNSGHEGLRRLDERTKEWEPAFRDYISQLLSTFPDRRLIIAGDLNVAAEDIDVHSPERHGKTAGFTPEERAAFRQLLSKTRVIDAFRALNPEVPGYTFFSNFARSRERNKGWRLDYFLVSSLEGVGSCYPIDVEGSDHIPVVMKLVGNLRSAVNTLLLAHEILEIEKGSVYGARAYRKAVQALPDVVEDMADVEGIPGYGPKILARVRSVVERGPKLVDGLRKRHMDLAGAAVDLMRVPGIGASAAVRLISRGVSSVSQLAARPELMTPALAAGVRHLDDMSLRIPRAEVAAHIAKVRSLVAGLATVHASGSFARGASDSGDIDVVMRLRKSTPVRVIEKLGGYEVAKLLQGETKYSALVRLKPGLPARRLDVTFVRKDAELPFALLYFNGPRERVVEMRRRARSKGFLLNERGLFERSGERATKQDVDEFLCQYSAHL